MEPGLLFTLLSAASGWEEILIIALLFGLAATALAVWAAQGWARVWLLAGIACLVIGNLLSVFLALMVLVVGERAFLRMHWLISGAAAGCAVLAFVASRERRHPLFWLSTLLLWLPLSWLMATSFNQHINTRFEQGRHAQQHAVQQRAGAKQTVSASSPTPAPARSPSLR
ncbi:hypothetical protein [Deinococcus sp.]|uniref:hypothetical protein n=1 Tax=Deinococcus sp. TaxID=47478 RepID=UPI003B595BFB